VRNLPIALNDIEGKLKDLQFFFAGKLDRGQLQSVQKVYIVLHLKPAPSWNDLKDATRELLISLGAIANFNSVALTYQIRAHDDYGFYLRTKAELLSYAEDYLAEKPGGRCIEVAIAVLDLYC
jgi:hypothetical protein